MQKQYSLPSKYVSYIGIIICFFVIFVAVYAPIIQNAYLYLDDWGILIPGGRTLEFLFDFNMGQGRTLGTVFLYVFSRLFTSIEFSTTIRFIGIIFLSLFAFVTYYIFKKYRFKSDHAFFMSTLIGVLPSSQILVSWATCVHFIFGAILSSLSALICFNITSMKINNGRSYKTVRIAVVIFLLISALNIYQPTAMMYWTIGVIFFLTRDNCSFSNQEFRQVFIMYFSVGMISMVLYYIVFIKTIPPFINPNLSVHRSLISPSDLTLILKWFITRPLKHAMNLWFLNPHKYIAIFISAIISIGIIRDISRKRKENAGISAGSYVTKYLLISALLILTFLPNLLTHSGHSYRFILALATALCILFCFSLINIVEFFLFFIPNVTLKMRNMTITILLISLTAAASFSAHKNVYDFAVLHSGEFEYIKSTIEDYGVDKLLRTSKINFRRPRYLHVPAEYRHNEFKINIATVNEGDWLSPKQSIALRDIKQGEVGGGMVRYVVMLALHELGVDQDISITQLKPSEPIPEENNVLTIDMLKFQETTR